MNFTEDSIKQLSPDDASTKAGLQLATTAKWVNAHIHERALWGECQGSGKNPYFTQIDLENIAFKCSCPSRKFPCKHGLGLLFLYAKKPDYFQAETDLHEKVEEWLGKRQERAETKVQKAEKPVDEAAQQKRVLQREKKVEDGLEELSLWMKDIIRTGIQNIPQNHYDVFRNITARMVDAQAGGIAGLLRNMEDLNYYQEGWEQVFMRYFSKIFFLTEAYKNSEKLSPEWQQELRTWIGWSTSKEELEKLPISDGKWKVLHTERVPFDKLIQEKTWLLSEAGELNFQLQFFSPQQSFGSQILLAGSVIESKLVCYPSVGGRRVWIKEYSALKTPFSLEGEPTSLETMLNQIGEWKAQNPFQDEFPFVLYQMKLIHSENKWHLIDNQGKSIIVEQAVKPLLKMWALTQSRPMNVFAVYQYGQLRILSFYFQNKYYTF